MGFIHEKKGWPTFSWEAAAVLPALGRVRHKQGLLLGRMRHLGFDLQAEATVEVLTSDVVRSSAIEGERLDAAAVRSSIARRLGVPQAGGPVSSRLQRLSSDRGRHLAARRGGADTCRVGADWPRTRPLRGARCGPGSR